MGKRSRKRPWHEAHRPLNMDSFTSLPRTEIGPNGDDYTVRQVRGSEKEYLCPGCLQTIPSGQPHIVAWANDGLFGASAALEDRRHWHSSCWKRRLRPQ